MGLQAAAGEFDGVLYVQHFVEEDVFDYESWDAIAIEVAA